MKTDIQKGILSLGEFLQSFAGQIFQVISLYLHSNFHTDEGVCWWISHSESFKEKVERVFPGISKAVAKFWSLGQTIRVEDEAGALSFGCRGGVADEHTLPSAQYENTSAAQMFASIVGLRSDGALEIIIRRTTVEDRFGASEKEESLHAICKMIHRMENPPSKEEILGWYSLALEAWYRELSLNPGAREENKPLTYKFAASIIKKIYGAKEAGDWMQLPRRAKSNFRARKRRMIIKLSEDRERGKDSKYWSPIKVRRFHNGESFVEDKHWMCVIETDSLEALKCALDLNASIVVIKNSFGNVVIVTDRRKAIDLSDVAFMLRDEELFLMGKASLFAPDQLRSRGSITEWPQMEPYWHLHNLPWLYFWKEQGGQKRPKVFPKTNPEQKGIPFTNKLYNGSESAEWVIPTRIPLQQIVKILKISLEGRFHSARFRFCIGGQCSRKCNWFSWNLRQCVYAREGDRV